MWVPVILFLNEADTRGVEVIWSEIADRTF